MNEVGTMALTDMVSIWNIGATVVGTKSWELMIQSQQRRRMESIKIE